MLKAALHYMRLGFSVLPLAPGEKRPDARLAPRGLKDATQDPAQAGRWWQAQPRAGVGILPPEEVLVLDVDSEAVLQELLATYRLAHAPRARTPRGGGHLYLRLPPGVRLTTTVGALPKVDLRGVGRAYLVAPPTVLPIGRYTWEAPLVPPAELPEAPKPLLEHLLPPPPPPRPSTWAPGQATPRRLRGLLEAFCARVASAQVGARHVTLVRYARAAGGLLPHGLAYEEALEALTLAGVQAGLPEREAREAAKWGLEIGAAAPLRLPDYWPSDGFVARGLATNPAPSSTAFSRFLANNTTEWVSPAWGEGVKPWA